MMPYSAPSGSAARVHAHPLLAGVAPTLRQQLAEFATETAIPGGERIFVEGGPANRFWLLESGAVGLGVHVPGRGDQIVETVAAGQLLGWSWLQPPYRWRFEAASIASVTAIEFDAAAVRRRCDDDPRFGYAIMRLFLPVVADRLQCARLRLLDLWAAAPERRSW
jgi:CRP/FNR family transcriptional regulator, cyclic AMP receptor protein